MMRARHALRLFLLGLAGTLALPLAIGVLALRAPSPGARAADGSLSVIATIRTGLAGRSPTALAVNPNTNLIYVTNLYSANVSVIDGASNTGVASVPVGTGSGTRSRGP